MKQLWEILVPTVQNDGKPFRLKGHHKPWDAKVQAIIGGLTLMPVINGRWSYRGMEFKERMIPVRLMATREEMDLIVEMTLEHYDQHAVMAYKVSDEVILRHKDDVCPKCRTKHPIKGWTHGMADDHGYYPVKES